ncbi:MAG: Rieske 2Fe-2S domain-containing protein, partial [Nitrospira sp.]
MLEAFWYIAGESTAIRASRPVASVLCNQPLVLFRDGQGRVHALEDRCPHKGVPLSSARQEGDSLRCPFHGWRFTASGECIEVPAIGNVAH